MLATLKGVINDTLIFTATFHQNIFPRLHVVGPRQDIILDRKFENDKFDKVWIQTDTNKKQFLS